MKQKQYILHSLIIEVTMVLLGFDGSVSSMQYAWNTNEFDSISYGHRICHTKTTIPSLLYLSKVYC